MAAETLAELDQGNPVQLLVTNLPKVELNHTVVAYDYRIYEGRFLEFIVYDPNEPEAPGWVAFDRADRRFFASGVYDTGAGSDPGLPHVLLSPPPDGHVAATSARGERSSSRGGILTGSIASPTIGWRGPRRPCCRARCAWPSRARARGCGAPFPPSAAG